MAGHIDKDILAALVREAGFVRVRFTGGGNFGFSGSSLMIAAYPATTESDAAGEQPVVAGPAAVIAPFARHNYYREAVALLKTALGSFLGDDGAGCRSLTVKDCRLFANSTLPEKAIARVAGLGVCGRNTLVAVPGTGSRCILAGAVLPFMVEPDPPAGAGLLGRACTACQACVGACPTGALGRPGTGNAPEAPVFIRERCIQNWASRFDVLPAEIADVWGNRLYGCTACQDACPLNAGTPVRAPLHVRGELPPAIPVGFLLERGASSLVDYFRGTALGMGWISKKALVRNGILAAASAWGTGTHSGAPELDRLIADAAATGEPPFQQAAAIYATTLHGD